jgi:hypothetical protein
LVITIELDRSKPIEGSRSMLKQNWAALRAWLTRNTHVCLREATTRLGLVVTAIATVLPNFARFDVRIAYVAAAAGVILVLMKPGGEAPASGAPAGGANANGNG